MSGSPCPTRSTPVWADLREMFDRQRQTNPDAYRLIYQGIGLDGITLPTDWTRREPSRAVQNPAYA